MGFLKLCWYNSIKNSGLVAPVSQSEIDERLAESHKTQCIMGHIYDGNDGSWMSHIDWKRDYESFSRPKWNLQNLDFY